MTSSNGNISALLVLCGGNSSVTGKFPTQRSVKRSSDVFLICAWVNNREAGALRHHCAHYDITVMHRIKGNQASFTFFPILKQATTTKKKYDPLYLIRPINRSWCYAVIGTKTFQTYYKWTMFLERFSWCYMYVTKLCCPPVVPKRIYYQSYNHFNEKSYVKDLHSAPFTVCDIFEDPVDKAWCFIKVLTNGMEKNAPLKSKVINKPQISPTWIQNTVRLCIKCFEINIKRD